MAELSLKSQERPEDPSAESDSSSASSSDGNSTTLSTSNAIPTTAKCACQSCGVHLEFALESAGYVVACPQCGQNTELSVPLDDDAAPETEVPSNSTTSPVSLESLTEAFTGAIPPKRLSFLYQAGLVAVAFFMVLLPIVYVALIVGAAWGVYYWGTHFSWLATSMAGGGRVYIFKLLLYAAPLISGVILVFFMIKPLFAPRGRHAQPLALNPGAEPVLFGFIHQICLRVGSPSPTRIDLDCHLNASAGFRRGFRSFLGNDLVLTLGLPLVATMTVDQLAAVIAHEFGHFRQGFGMRLSYLIHRINGWFARVVYQRDAWDQALEDWGQQMESGYATFLVFSAQCAVGISRFFLKLLMMAGHGVSCFLSRQMEYDADYCEVQMSGTATYEETMKRLHMSSLATKHAYKDMRAGWNLNRHLPENFCEYFMEKEHSMAKHIRDKHEQAFGLDRTKVFDTHPSMGDRIRAARILAAPGIFSCSLPATALFQNFSAVSKQVTALHYEDDLGIPLDMARLMPVEKAAHPVI